ncbi:Plexin-A2 [Holothuria leucospilota]|uniref:Plexin-A2 n=1 Tax=Holothuria leucospilota TaxID=206669 RepID=A0A9Q1H3G1_HOLLE|nr:Plexin-A2 [Holothuria leucospilota]
MAAYNMFSVAYFLLFVAFTVVTADHVNEFLSRDCTADDHGHIPCGRIVSLSQSQVTRDVYITLENGIYELDGSLRPNTFVFTSESGKNQQNDLMVVTTENIVLCKNDFEGSCELRDLKSLDVIKGVKQVEVVNTKHGGFSLGWVAKGPDEHDVLNIALSNKDKDSSAPILSTRKLVTNKTSSSWDFLSILKNEFSVPASQFLNDRQHSVRIDPIIGFSHGNYNFIVKRQTDTRGDSEAKLIRLCRRDINYRSYIELPLRCRNDMGEIFKNVTSAFYSSDILFISFYEDLSYMDDNSVICLYNLTTLNNRFYQRRKECLLGQSKTTEIDWYQRIPCPTEPVPPNVFNISYLDDPNFCYELDTAHPLGGNDPITEDAIFSVEAKVNALVVGVFEGDMIYFLGDSNGNIIKMRAKGGIWEKETLSIEEGSPILSPNGFILDVDGEWMYAMTHKKATRVRVDFTPATTPPSLSSMDPSEDATNQPPAVEPLIIYIICGSAAVAIIIIVVILAFSIKFGLKKYNMSVG